MPANLPIYRVCGIRLATRFPFASRLQPLEHDPAILPDLYFHSDFSANFSASASKQLLFESPYLTAQGEPVITLYRSPEFEQFHFPAAGMVLIGGNEIIAQPEFWHQRHLAEACFFNPLLPYHLERSGRVMLHASAVLTGEKALAFLGVPGAGKSTLAAYFLRYGSTLITDDLLAVEPVAPPQVQASLPTLRLSSSVVTDLFGATDNFRSTGPNIAKYFVPVGKDIWGTYADGASTLHRIYLPHRREPANGDTAIRIERLSPADSVMALVRHSSLPRLPHALGWHGDRFQKLVQIADQISFRRLSYPSGLHFLPAIYDAVCQDLRSA